MSTHHDDKSVGGESKGRDVEEKIGGSLGGHARYAGVCRWLSRFSCPICGDVACGNGERRWNEMCVSSHVPRRPPSPEKHRGGMG